MDDLLRGSGDQNVGFLEQEVLPSVRLRAGKANDSTVLQLIFLQGLWVDSLLVVDASVILGHTDTRGPGTCQIAARMKTHVTEPLDDVGLAAPARGVADQGHVGALIDEVLQAMVNSSPGGAGAAVNTSLVDRLSYKKLVEGRNLNISGCLLVGKNAFSISLNNRDLF